tara:strand:+ start:46 stop:342 length:297 start_codon:yes stop_codon:yes gene_type:complete
MPRSEDTMGIIFCDKERKFIPSFGKSQKAKATKIIAVIIETLFRLLKLSSPDLSILFTVSLVLLLRFFLKNGLKIHITNEIKTTKRIRRTIKNIFCLC